MKAFLLRILLVSSWIVAPHLLVARQAVSAPNPFETFLGNYEVQAYGCEVNGHSVIEGCYLEEVKVRALNDSIQIQEIDDQNYAIFPMTAFRTATPDGVVQAKFSGGRGQARWMKTQVTGSGEITQHWQEERSLLRDGSSFVYQVSRNRKVSGQPDHSAVKTYRLEMKKTK